MTKFYEFIKNYISDKFSADTDIVADVSVVDAEISGFRPSSTKNEVYVQIIDVYENTPTTTFSLGETSSTITMQFTSFASKQKIGGEMKNARQVARIFGDKIIQYLNILKVDTTHNQNIIGCRHTTTSPVFPFQDGEKIFTTAVRYEFVVNTPYQGE